MKLILVALTLISLSCSNSKTVYEIKIDYNRKMDEYTIIYPPYNKVNPRSVPVDFFKNNSFEDTILFTYNLETDNLPLAIEVSLIQDNIEHLYSLEYPYVGDRVSKELNLTDFEPNIDPSKKIEKALIKLKTEGDIDTSDVLKVSVKGSKKILKEKEKNKYSFRENAKLILPRSGNYASSNPPFIVLDEALNKSTIKISKNINFDDESTYQYIINGKEFLQMTNVLDSGKWFIKIEDEESSIYSFFISDEQTKMSDMYNLSIPIVDIQRPFIFINTNNLSALKYYYDLNRIPRDNVLSKNILSFKEYSENNLYNWNKNKIYYGNTDIPDNSIGFNSLPSHTMIMSLYGYLNLDNLKAMTNVIQTVKDVSDIDITTITDYSEIEASYILAMSLLLPFDLLYDSFNADELLRVKTGILRSGDILYNYLISNKVSFYEKDSLKYASTLALISLNMLNENLRENDVRKWYEFSMNYVTSLIAVSIHDDGSLKVPISESFEYLMPIVSLATTLKNANIFNYFDTESFSKLGYFLSVVGYPSGYTMPFGDNIIDYRTDIRYDNGARNVVMELLSREYNNALYKNYANYGYAETIETSYLPYSLMWHNYRNYGAIPARTFFAYQYGYFKNIETVIYNQNFFNKRYAYFALYAKGNYQNKSYNMNHKDRLSFVYYNYGDKIIDEAGFSMGANIEAYSQYAHSIMTIDDLDVRDYPGTYTYIKSSVNNNNLLYTHAEANPIHSYNFNIKDYSRRFYYFKPNMIVIKDNIEVLNNITDNIDSNKKYTWRFTSRLPVSYNQITKMFNIVGSNSITDVNILLDDEYNHEITSMDIGESSPLYVVSVVPKSKKEIFSPWVVILTKENNRPITDVEVLSFNKDTIEFNTRGRKYFINAGYTNVSTNISTNVFTNIVDYTENRQSVTILSD